MSMFLMLGHVGHGGDGGFWAGMSHPVLGLDHLLAMASAGLLALWGRETVNWRVPGAFLAGMLLGGVLGLFPIVSEPLEIGIVLSMTVFGLMLVLNRPEAGRFLPAVVGFFAMFHGHAHVLEGPEGSALWMYGAGFLVGTAALMGGGILLGLICKELPWGYRGVRIAGALVVAASVVFLFE